MQLTIVSLLFACLSAVSTAPTSRGLESRDISSSTIFNPPATNTQPGTRYAHSALLSDGSILAIFENYTPDMSDVGYPVYRSTDNGVTWAPHGEVKDTQNGWGMRYEPSILQLDTDLGNLTKGTILCTGTSSPPAIDGTKIELYASSDNGVTWTFVSHIASGDAHPMGGEMANSNVWESHMLVHNGTLIVHYSDQRDANHYQMISHQTTTDGITWTDPFYDVAEADPTLGPGMPAVAAMPDGNFILAYEIRGPDYAISYRISSDPCNFADSPEHPLLPQDGSKPVSSPQVAWSSFGVDWKGTLVLGSYSQGSIFTNTNLGDPDSWQTVATAQPQAYSRGYLVLPDQSHILITGGGTKLAPPGAGFGSTQPSTTGNVVVAGVVALPGN